MAVPTQVVAAEVGDGMIMLTLTTTDPTVDLKAAALGLATIAIGRAVEGNTSGPTDATTDGTSAGTGAATEVDVCSLASPEEVAAALGLDIQLRLDDYDLYCSYEGGQGERHTMVYVTTQDPTDFDLMIAAIGATEIEGTGDAAWWWKDYASLFARQGDLILQVAITADGPPSDAELQAMAVAVMELFLAP
jgi:hypothetical protein